jgi:hypothetical protein
VTLAVTPLRINPLIFSILTLKGGRFLIRTLFQTPEVWLHNLEARPERQAVLSLEQAVLEGPNGPSLFAK